MSAYVLGFLTLPAGMAALFVVTMVARLGYYTLGKVTKFGVIRYGKRDDEYRLRAGAVAAQAGRVLLLNKGTTGVIFFSASRNPHLSAGGTGVYESFLRKAEHEIDTNYNDHGQRRLKPGPGRGSK